MKRLFLAVTVLLAGFTACGYAGLGETSAQLEAGYGTAVDIRKDDTGRIFTKYYLYDGFGISVRFLNGTSQCETCMKQDKSAISGQEITAILKANALGSDWLGVYRSPGFQRWELKSRKATAVYYRSTHTLVVETKEFIRSGSKIIPVDPSAH
jgi:hypothetical protein